jgi:cellulose synthase/poly-beta-1,6-N-acetylglucosamine synthase-like glycosyltransferase
MNAATSQPELTVLITAHNEADRIQPCLHAIAEQDYPLERIEILLVDDRSSDGTAERARATELDGLRVLRIDDLPEKGLTARQAALDRGFKEARGEVVLVTDADGRAPREWIRELTGHLGYRDGAATAPVVFAGGSPFLARYQTLDMFVLFTLQRWANRHGRATGINGANMAVRREAYLETGGFPSVGFALGEDQALGRALCRAGWSLRYLSGPACQKQAAKSIVDLLGRARRRSYDMSPALRGITLLMIITNLILIGAAAVWGGFWLFVLLARYAIGMLMIGISASQYGSYDTIHWVWLYEPMMTFLGVWVHLGNLIRPHWRWGGVSYDRPVPEPSPPAAPPVA